MMFRRLRADDREQGATAILVALVLVVLLGFAALVVDVGHLFQVRGELQNGADAAALAGAQILNGNADGITKAQTTVMNYAAQHWANFQPLGGAFDSNDIKVEFGTWYFRGQALPDGAVCEPPAPPATPPCFVLDPSPAANAVTINAVRVTAYRSDSHNSANSPVGHSFAMFIGKRQSNVLAQAVAVGGGPSRDCGFPMVVADCALDESFEDPTNPEGPDWCDYCMSMHGSQDDNAAWTTFFEGNIGNPTIAALIKNMCLNDDGTGNDLGTVNVDPDTLECLGECSHANVGDDIVLKEGDFFGTGADKNSPCKILQHILRRGVDDAPFQPFKVRVPVVDTGMTAANCDPDFRNTLPLEGWAELTIYYARCGGSDKDIDETTTLPASCSVKWAEGTFPPPTDKYVIAALDCQMDTDNFAGGPFYGVLADHVLLVQ